MDAKNTQPDTIWLIVSQLLQHLALGHWRQAAYWARSLVAHLRGMGDSQ